MGSKNSVTWLSNRFSQTTTHLQRNIRYTVVIRPYFQRLRVRGSKFFVKKRRYRISFTKRGQSRILQPNLCNSKEGRRQKDDFKCETFEQIHQKASVQDANSSFNFARIKSRGLGCKTRSKRRLLPYTHSHRLQEVPQILSTGEMLPVQSSVFWPNHRSKSFHKDNGSGGGIPSLSPDLSVPISGRLADKCKLIHRSTRKNSCANRHGSKSGVDNKCREISALPIPEIRIPGDESGPKFRDSKAYRRKVQTINTNAVGVQGKYDSNSEIISETLGFDGSMHRPSSVGSSPHEAHSNVSFVPMAPSLSGLKGESSDQSITNSTSRLVEIQEECFPGDRITVQECTSSHDYGCVSPWMGSPHQQQTDQRNLGEAHSPVKTHKLVGNAGSISRPATLQRSDQEQVGPSKIRQHNCSVLSEQTRGDKIPRPLFSVMAAPEVVHGSKHNHKSSPHSRTIKRDSRQTVQRNPIKSDRMVIDISNSESNILDLGSSSHRPVRLNREQETSDILFTGTRSECPGDGCIYHLLGGHSCLRLSSSNITEQSSEKDTRGELHCGTDSPIMAKTALVSNDTRSSDISATKTTKSQQSSVSVQGKSSSPRPSISKFSCVETVKRQKVAKGFSDRTADTMASARRQSTSGTYDARINRFRSWCEERNVNPISAAVTEVAEFLQELFDKNKFSPTTIAGYKSAISVVHQGFDGRPLGQNKDLCTLITGMYQLRPAKRVLIPNWSLPLVLNMLLKPPFEPLETADIKFVTLKTVFLVAVTSGRRVSEIHALSVDDQHLRWEGNGRGVRLLTNTQFLAKNESLKNPGKDIFLSSFDRFISDPEEGFWCPCRALKVYLKRTSAVRGETSKLFLTFKKGNVHGASKDSISRWIVDTVKIAYELAGNDDFTVARAHDTRSLSSSWALFQGVRVDEIMRAAFWSAETTFTSFYLKDIIWDDAAFSLSSLNAARLWKKKKKKKLFKK